MTLPIARLSSATCKGCSSIIRIGWPATISAITSRMALAPMSSTATDLGTVELSVWEIADAGVAARAVDQ